MCLIKCHFLLLTSIVLSPYPKYSQQRVMGKTDIRFHQYVSMLASSLASVQAPSRCNIEFQKYIVKKLFVPLTPWLYIVIFTV